MTLLRIVDAEGLLQSLDSLTEFDDQLSGIVSKIISRVRNHGDQALFDYTLEFDKVQLKNIRVDRQDLVKAHESVDCRIRQILQNAIRNIKHFHEHQKQESWTRSYGDGTILGEKVTPLDRVGIYTPGGKAFYPSTIIMNAIPAQIAGVKSIAVASPPGPEGLPHPLVLAICYLLGLEEVLAVGGAQIIAALSYGTDSIDPVCKVTGPGNKFVAEAKRQVFGKVGIDSIAGPSEIVILHNDSDVPAEYLARDLLTQAEHDEDARAILITTLPETAAEVQSRIDQLVPGLPRKEIITKSLQSNGCIVVVDTIEKGIQLVNKIAPEHLELMVKDRTILDKINNAGAIFIGKWSSETIGDYFAGPNHTIPTSGAAKYGSPLSVRDFQKHSSLIEYSKQRLQKEADDIAEFADLEGLNAHAEAIRVRQQ